MHSIKLHYIVKPTINARFSSTFVETYQKHYEILEPRPSIISILTISNLLFTKYLSSFTDSQTCIYNILITTDLPEFFIIIESSCTTPVKHSGKNDVRLNCTVILCYNNVVIDNLGFAFYRMSHIPVNHFTTL